MTIKSEGLITVALFILLAPLLRHWPSAWRRLRYWGSGSWPSVPASIKVRGVREDSSDHGKTYRPYLTYTYDWEGQEYIGHFNGDIYGLRQDAESAVSETCKRPPVMVRVHPRRPKTSVLVLK